MASNGEEKNKRESSDDADLQARLDKLGRALETRDKAAEADQDASSLAAQSAGSAMNLGFRVLTEFVAAIVVGTLIGWQIDVWLKTGPIFLIAFLALGTAAGFLGVYRIAMGPKGPKGGAGL